MQGRVPAVAWSEVEILIRQELSRPLEECFTSIEERAIAAGSIGQVHRAILKNGEKVALKVQRPGIEKVVVQDIALIKNLAELASLTDFGKDYDIVALAEEFTSALEAELDFTSEAQYTETLKRNLAESRWFATEKLVVPKVYWEVTSPKILTIEWLEGTAILETELPQTRDDRDVANQRKEITTLLFRAFFQQIYLDGFFHADPQPGNIF